MKKLDLGQSLTILANMGVIAGIIFLGIEIRDSNTQARIATTQEAVSNLSSWRADLAADEDLTEIYTKGLAALDQLSPNDQARFSLLMQAQLLTLGANLIARNAGLLNVNPEQAMEARVLEGQILALLEQPGFLKWWSTVDRRGLPSGIVSLVDTLRTRAPLE